MEKKTIAILFGGCSSEYTVSLSSASSVIENIDSEKYNIILIGITKNGEWYRYRGTVDEIRKNNWFNHDCVSAIISPCRGNSGLMEFYKDGVITTKIDVAFPMFHGKNGEDGTIQGLFEIANIPYVGCGVLASSISMDKDIAHILVNADGIDTPKAVILYKVDNIEEKADKAEEFGYPLYVKPVNAGSSIGITKAKNREELINGIKTAFEYDYKVIIEENIDGFEVGCSVLGNFNPVIGEVDEIEITGDFFDFGEKYTLLSSKIHMPARIDSEKAAKCKEIALKIYRTLCCKGMARIDLFISTDGRIVFNEVNTIPGFTGKSRFPNMLKGIGFTYSQIIDRLIELALEK